MSKKYKEQSKINVYRKWSIENNQCICPRYFNPIYGGVINKELIDHCQKACEKCQNEYYNCR